MKDTRFVSLLAVSALLAASLAGCGSSAGSSGKKEADAEINKSPM